MPSESVTSHFPILTALIQVLTASRMDYCHCVPRCVDFYEKREAMEDRRGEEEEQKAMGIFPEQCGDRVHFPEHHSSIPGTWTYSWEMDHYWKEKNKDP